MMMCDVLTQLLRIKDIEDRGQQLTIHKQSQQVRRFIQEAGYRKIGPNNFTLEMETRVTHWRPSAALS